MRELSIKVVSAHFNEDLRWISKLKYATKVYSKTIPGHNFIPFNKVQEVPAYLKFIIDNYYELPDYTIFVHGHEYSPHQNDSIVNIINSIKFEKDIINLNRPDWYNKYDSTKRPDWSWIEDNWADIFKNYLALPTKLWFPAGAQFAVKKDCILKYPIEFYVSLYNWCQETKLDNYISSRIFEYTWFYIFSGNEIFA
jgi:hypothetical protein